MQYFKNKSNAVFAYEDDCDEEFILEGLIKISEPEALAILAPTVEEQIAAAELQKQRLINQANEYMNSKQWPGKAAMGRLKDAEKAQYNMWLDYLDALEAVETSSAPDIKWPTPPGEQAS